MIKKKDNFKHLFTLADDQITVEQSLKPTEDLMVTSQLAAGTCGRACQECIEYGGRWVPGPFGGHYCQGMEPQPSDSGSWDSD